MKQSMIAKPIVPSMVGVKELQLTWANDFPPQIDYPQSLVLWDRKIDKSRKLKIINTRDFNQANILRALNINETELVESLGICDEVEIRERLTLMEYLTKSVELRRLLMSARVTKIPQDHSDYLIYYEPGQEHNSFWTLVHKLYSLFKEVDEPKGRLQEFLDVIKSSFCLEEYENELSRAVNRCVEALAFVEGVVEFKLDLFLKENEITQNDPSPVGSFTVHNQIYTTDMTVWGHRAFSLSAVKYKDIPYPYWVNQQSHILNKVKLGALARVPISIINQKRKKMSMRPMVIDKISDGMLQDIRRGVLEILTKKLTVNSSVFREAYPKGSLTARVKVRFSYTKEGLKINVFDIIPTNLGNTQLPFSFFSFEGFVASYMEKILSTKDRCEERLTQHYETFEELRFASIVKGTKPDFFNHSFLVQSPRFDEEHRWFALPNLFLTPVLKRVYKPLVEFRRFVDNHLTTLNAVADLADEMVKSCKAMGVPLSIPQVVEGDSHSIIQFEEIYPIHLTTQNDDIKLKPIRNLPELNGKGLCLTGSHGGGKTVTQETLAYSLYLFQSGLPVPGRGFKANVKDALGVVFLERGAGSTCELMVEKIVKIFESLKDYESGKIVLFLDELGTGTQEVSGFALGKEILETLTRQGVSIVFSTQILDLAKYAEKELKVVCFYLDKSHVIHLGIRDGGMDELKKKYKLDKLIKKI